MNQDKIYRIIDSFLVEAKDQNGNDRSLERLNQDRHLAAEQLLNLLQKAREEEIKTIGDAKENKITKAWIIEDGKWAIEQMLVYKTKKSAQERIYKGGMAKVWKVYPCEIKIIK